MPLQLKVGPATLVGPLGPPVMVGGPGTVESIRKDRDWLSPPPALPALSKVRMYQRRSVFAGRGCDQTSGLRADAYWSRSRRAVPRARRAGRCPRSGP